MNTTEFYAGGYDLAEDLIAGIEVIYPDKAEQYRAIIGYAEYLRKHHIYGMPDALLAHIDRDDCLREGVCPDCGGDVTVTQTTEHHPYGMGTAAERLRWYVCEGCGRV